MINEKIKVGDIVRHKETRLIRTVIALYDSQDVCPTQRINGGVRLDKSVEGFVSWNTEDLTFVRHSINSY